MVNYPGKEEALLRVIASPPPAVLGGSSLFYCARWLSQILAERDMLGNQLLKRNQELALLYEKVKIQESTLAKGEAQYKVCCAAH